MAEISKHVAGTYKISWNNVELGYTEEGFMWTIAAADAVRIREDRFGAAPVNGLILGIESMSIGGTFTWFTSAIWNACNPLLNRTSGLSAYPAGTQINPGYGNGGSSYVLAKPLLLTKLTGLADDNSLKTLSLNCWPRGGLQYLLSAASIIKTPAVWDVYPIVGTATDGTQSLAQVEPTWFTAVYGA